MMPDFGWSNNNATSTPAAVATMNADALANVPTPPATTTTTAPVPAGAAEPATGASVPGTTASATGSMDDKIEIPRAPNNWMIDPKTGTYSLYLGKDKGWQTGLDLAGFKAALSPAQANSVPDWYFGNELEQAKTQANRQTDYAVMDSAKFDAAENQIVRPNQWAR